MKRYILPVITLFLTLNTVAQETGQAPFRLEPIYNNENTSRENIQYSDDPEVYADSRAERQRPRGQWFFGGSIGRSFGTYSSFHVAPRVGYRWNQYLTTGGGLTYSYYEHRDRDYGLNYFGMFLYGRVFPVRYIHLLAQGEVHRRWGDGVRRYERFNNGNDVLGCLLLGGGGVIPISSRHGLMITFYYDVIQDVNSPYGDNVGYSIGYTFNF